MASKKEALMEKLKSDKDYSKKVVKKMQATPTYFWTQDKGNHITQLIQETGRTEEGLLARIIRCDVAGQFSVEISNQYYDTGTWAYATYAFSRVGFKDKVADEMWVSAADANEQCNRRVLKLLANIVLKNGKAE